MAISRGGGYCDCGDRAAWKLDAQCALHQSPNGDDTVAEENLKLDNADIERRIRFLFSTFLDYASTMLTANIRFGTPLVEQIELADARTAELLSSMFQNSDSERIKKQIDTKVYCVIVFHDASQSFDLIAKSLEKFLGITYSEAVDYTTIMEEDGRVVVKIGEMPVYMLLIILCDRIGARNLKKCFAKICRIVVASKEG